MTITAYVEREVKRNELSQELVTELKKTSDDIEFIGGVLLNVENDEDKKALLDYIRAGIDVDFSQIILTSLWLYQQREENTQDNQKLKSQLSLSSEGGTFLFAFWQGQGVKEATK